MQLREHIWRRRLQLKARKLLPKIYKTYSNTDTWTKQLQVLECDLARMPHMNRGNVIKLVQRHAAAVPNHPYTQGHLYLIRTMALVFGDESSLFWGYTHICRFLYPYGPDTAWGVHVLPRWIFDATRDKLQMCPDLFDVVLRMRWVFILFGQTFTSSSCICTVWDYVLNNAARVHRLCYALLMHGLEHEPEECKNMCPLQRMSLLVSAKFESDVVVAGLIARAQAVCIPCGGR